MTIAQSIARTQRIVPVKWDNAPKEIMKNKDGSVLVSQNSGEQFTIPAGEIEMQAFIVYLMLNKETTQSKFETA